MYLSVAEDTMYLCAEPMLSWIPSEQMISYISRNQGYHVPPGAKDIIYSPEPRIHVSPGAKDVMYFTKPRTSCIPPEPVISYFTGS
jgi:hypothetical protein